MHVGNAKLGWGSIWVHDGFGKTVTKEKYVGDVLSADGSNTDKVEESTDKSFGIVNEILPILSEIPPGSIQNLGRFKIERSNDVKC